MTTMTTTITDTQIEALSTEAAEAGDLSADSSGWLCDYQTGARIRQATEAEETASKAAAEHDGGAGVILIDGVRCYVED